VSGRAELEQLSLSRNSGEDGCVEAVRPLVPVVETANLRYRNDGSAFRRVHRPRFRRVLGQREVRPGFVIIRQERLDMPVQLGLAEDNHLIQTLAPKCADHAFHESSVPR
jgi:hypothetical protein